MMRNDSNSNKRPFFCMGLDTYKVPADFHAQNRKRVLQALKVKLKLDHQQQKQHALSCCLMFLKGGSNSERNDTDHEPIFRQESYFHYLFGVKEPDYAGVIDVATGEVTLFMPRLSAEDATFMGKILSPDDVCDIYQVDRCMYTDEFETVLLGMLEQSQDRTNSDDKSSTSTDAKSLLLLLEGRNSDSGNMYVAPKFNDMRIHHLLINVDVDKTTLFPILAECRVIKSAQEMDLMRHVAELTSEAHVEIMRNCKPGMTEWQMEAMFRHYVYFNYGCRNVGYTPICACGPSSSVLHYGHAGAPNARTLLETDLCLMDMGTEYHCYGSDITCSFPASGHFSEDQRIIYEGVLHAQVEVISLLKPGQSWVECHEAAEAAILKSLIKLGAVKYSHTKDISELVECRVGAVFMPHGLGHFIGIDTHDVGGYLPGYRERLAVPGLKSLRTARMMQEGMVVTVEPGCYFIDHLLDVALSDDSLSKYLVRERIRELRGIGGVRLEDVIKITADGCDNFTRCPRTVDEVELVMNGGKWPPIVDSAPQLRRTQLTSI